MQYFKTYVSILFQVILKAKATKNIFFDIP